MTPNPITKAAGAEPVTLAGLITGAVAFLVVRYGHLDANTADQLAVGVVPLVGGLIARQFVTPARRTQLLTAEQVVAAISDALHSTAASLPAPSSFQPPITPPPLPVTAAASTEPAAAIPAPPEPWVAPVLDVQPILPGTTWLDAAPVEQPAPEPAPAG